MLREMFPYSSPIVGNRRVISDKGKEFAVIYNHSEMIFSFVTFILHRFFVGDYDIRRYNTRTQRSRDPGKAGSVAA
jgi:hypothetical protein